MHRIRNAEQLISGVLDFLHEHFSSEFNENQSITKNMVENEIKQIEKRVTDIRTFLDKNEDKEYIRPI